MLCTIRCLEDILIAEVQSVRIRQREHQRIGPRVARRGRQVHFGRDVLRLAGLDVAACDGAAEHDPRIERVGRRVPALTAGAQRFPVAHGDVGEAAACPHADGAAVLLRTRYPVRKVVVGGDVIQLRDRLIQPRAPRRMLFQTIDADDGSLISAEDHAVPVVRMNPQLVIVVAAGRALERLTKGAAAIARAIDPRVRYVHEIRVLRIDDHLAEVPAASPDSAVV